MKPPRVGTRTCIALALGLASFLLMNWCYEYERILEYRMGGAFSDIDGVRVTDGQRWLGGWPLKYYAASRYSDGIHFQSLSWLRLLGNISIWVLVIAFVWIYERWWLRVSSQDDRLVLEDSVEENASADPFADGDLTTASAANPDSADSDEADLDKTLQAKQKVAQKLKDRNVSISDVLVLTAIVAAIATSWQLFQARADEHLELSREINSKVSYATRSAYFPKVFANLLPNAMRESFLRITRVSLSNPTDDLVEKVLELPNLEAICLGGGTYDLRLLDSIASRPFLRELRVSGRKIDSELLSAIAATKQLQSLNLMRTNVTEKGLSCLGEMPALRSLNVVHTDVQLTGDSTPAWAGNIEIVLLPHPPFGEVGNHAIVGWPNLVSVRCIEYDEHPNSRATSLTLHDLPKLKRIGLDTLQLFDLDLAAVPELETIETIQLQLQDRVRPGTNLGNLVWLGNLKISGETPKLKPLEFLGHQLRFVSIEDCRDLHVGIEVPQQYAPQAANGIYYGNVYSGAYSGAYYQPGAAETEQQKLPVPTRQVWIDWLQDANGPKELDYSHLPLSGLDFSPMLANDGIRWLDFSFADVTHEQFLSLRTMKSLDYLTYQQQLDASVVMKLVEAMPELKGIQCHVSGNLRLRNHANLRFVSMPDLSTLQYSNALHFENLPSFIERVPVGAHCEYFAAIDVPKMEAIVFNGPLPKRCTVRGLKDLRTFAAGGPTLTPEIIDEVLKCDGLKTLTLAHCGLSQEQVARIGELKQLEYLCLSGVPLQEKQLESWAALPNLKTLRLDETGLDSGAVASLVKHSSLEELHLPSLASKDTKQISTLSRLKVLSVGEADLNADALRSLGECKALRDLALGGSTIGKAEFDVLSNSSFPPIDHLRLQNSVVDGESLVRFCQLKTAIIDLTDAEIPPKYVDYLLGQERAIVEEDAFSGQSFAMLSYYSSNIGHPDFGKIPPDMYLQIHQTAGSGQPTIYANGIPIPVGSGPNVGSISIRSSDMNSATFSRAEMAQSILDSIFFSIGYQLGRSIATPVTTRASDASM